MFNDFSVLFCVFSYCAVFCLGHFDKWCLKTWPNLFCFHWTSFHLILKTKYYSGSGSSCFYCLHILFTATHELVFVNFYADWCRFSQILAPVFEEASNKVKEMYPVRTSGIGHPHDFAIFSHKKIKNCIVFNCPW